APALAGPWSCHSADGTGVHFGRPTAGSSGRSGPRARAAQVLVRPHAHSRGSGGGGGGARPRGGGGPAARVRAWDDPSQDRTPCPPEENVAARIIPGGVQAIGIAWG